MEICLCKDTDIWEGYQIRSILFSREASALVVNELLWHLK